jgi:hypothetical protein
VLGVTPAATGVGDDPTVVVELVTCQLVEYTLCGTSVDHS